MHVIDLVSEFLAQQLIHILTLCLPFNTFEEISSNYTFVVDHRMEFSVLQETGPKIASCNSKSKKIKQPSDAEDSQFRKQDCFNVLDYQHLRATKSRNALCNDGNLKEN